MCSQHINASPFQKFSFKVSLEETVQSKMLNTTMRKTLKDKMKSLAQTEGPNTNVQNEGTFTDNILAINPSGT